MKKLKKSEKRAISGGLKKHATFNVGLGKGKGAGVSNSKDKAASS